MIPADIASDLAAEIRADIDRAKAAILDGLLLRLDRLADAALADADDDLFSAPSPEPLDADEARAVVRPVLKPNRDAPTVEPAPAPEPEEFAVVRAAPAVEPTPPSEPSKRPRRRTPPPPVAPPGPVDEAVPEAESTDDFASLPF